MKTHAEPSPVVPLSPTCQNQHYLRFHFSHAHLDSVFGNDWFALKAEAFARFFGTPGFLVAQTFIVSIWIVINVLGLMRNIEKIWQERVNSGWYSLNSTQT